MILLMTTDPPKESPWGLGRRFPPLGLSYVAGALVKAGYQVEMLDNYLLKKPIGEVKEIVKRLSPQIVGITCGSVTFSRCIETAKAVKAVLPSCKVVVGGWHPSYLPESLLQHPEIDYVIMGEGERAIVELTECIVKGVDDSGISKISGLAYRKEKNFVKNAPDLINNLDDVPFPARKKIWGSKCRAFSAPRVVEELNILVSEYGTKGIYFVGDNFTINKKRTIELCNAIKKEKLDLQWVCDTRVDLISRDLVKEMKTAGCRTIWFGVESGSARVLKKINKQITLQQALAAFKLCKEEDVRTASSFMLGLPGETVEDMKATYKFARKLDPDWVRFNIFVGYPGSDLYDEIKEKGLYERVEDYVLLVKTPDFDYELVEKIQRSFHKNFNRSFKRIIRTIRRDGFLNVLRRNI
ncbi:MAG: radical SAM protein [Candidatus Bathyarchaeota archaeon]